MKNETKSTEQNNLPVCGVDTATHNAMNWREGVSFSDGSTTVGVSADHLAVCFGPNVPHNQNMILQLTQKDAQTLYALLTAALRQQKWLA